MFGDSQPSLTISPGDVLNIYAPNDIDVGAVIYGTFFAGGIVSPANPGYSPDELAFQLNNSGSKAIVTTKAFLPAALKAAAKASIPESRILVLGEEHDDSGRFTHWTRLGDGNGSHSRRKADPKDLAFLVYSSGTTGLPKGEQKKPVSRIPYTHDKPQA
jgi:acyl-CoA synthetase (AMP-forming)/AMP-acid ligase II